MILEGTCRDVLATIHAWTKRLVLRGFDSRAVRARCRSHKKRRSLSDELDATELRSVSLVAWARKRRTWGSVMGLFLDWHFVPLSLCKSVRYMSRSVDLL
jgi:hypothetical protein